MHQRAGSRHAPSSHIVRSKSSRYTVATQMYLLVSVVYHSICKWPMNPSSHALAVRILELISRVERKIDSSTITTLRIAGQWRKTLRIRSGYQHPPYQFPAGSSGLIQVMMTNDTLDIIRTFPVLTVFYCQGQIVWGILPVKNSILVTHYLSTIPSAVAYPGV